ncbi:MAG: TetR family transcriptional regulator C-terminal domain-containing protein [Bifidobacteriaceae bacterium]|jgi:AcrR family transcriptional regulator|nr:TetR family transcriptional regulator C-terminal domain-containing protein [Bifidobacteriaceae bacterium]
MPRHIDLDARKAQLAEAVWQVILDQGISAVSVRTVAAQAGLVVGSLRHVFPTRAQLIEFSAELMVERATMRVQAVPAGDDPEAYALAVIAELLPLEPHSRAEFEVNLALLAESTALPGLVAIRDHAHQEIGHLCRHLVTLLRQSAEMGTVPISSDPDRDGGIGRDAQRLHALIDGLAFHLLHCPVDADPTWALDLIRDELARIGHQAQCR